MLVNIQTSLAIKMLRLSAQNVLDTFIILAFTDETEQNVLNVIKLKIWKKSLS